VRHKAAAVVAVALLSTVLPRPAYALWGGGWLERLSGPGPFRGQVLDYRFLCIAAPDAKDESSTSDPPPGKIVTRELRDRVWLTGAGCHFLGSDDKRLEVGVDFGFLRSTENVLDYGNRPGLTDDDKDVGLRTFAVTADFRVNRILDVGAGFGRASFRSPDADLFPGFSRTMSQPVRLTVRPLAALSNSRRAEALVMRFDATKFHGTFTADDFGAVPGTFTEPGEITWGWSIRIDPLAFLWR
jgi:hypothetical protein